MFSEGFNYQLTEPFGMRSVSDVLRATQDTLNAAARANVSFYTIDPRGLDGAGTDFMQMSGPGMPNGATQTAIREELQRSQDSLRVLAEETGGFASLNTNSFASAFDRIVQSNSQYYVLGIRCAAASAGRPVSFYRRAREAARRQDYCPTRICIASAKRRQKS